MALKIRLSRGGSKKRPFFRIVVTEESSPRDSGFIEKLGTYDPMLPKTATNRLSLKKERIQHWMGVGAQVTDRVAYFFQQEGLMQAPKRYNPEQAKPKAKAQERLKSEAAAVEAAAAKAEADKAAAEQAKIDAAAAAEQAKADAAAAAAAPAPAPEAPAAEAVAEEAPAEAANG